MIFLAIEARKIGIAAANACAPAPFSVRSPLHPRLRDLSRERASEEKFLRTGICK